MAKRQKKKAAETKPAKFKPPARIRFPKAPLITWPDPAASNGTKAKASITPAGIKLVEKMARGAHPEYGIANTLGVSRPTFKRMRDEQPELQAALDSGRAGLEVELVHYLLEAAKLGQYACAMFLLKTRCSYRESGPTDGEQAGVAINISIPEGMSRAEFEKMIDITPKMKELTPPAIDAEFEEVPAPRTVTR